MKISLRLAELLGDKVNRRGLLAEIQKECDIERHTVVSWLNNKARYVSLDALGQVADYLVKRGANRDLLPGACWDATPSIFGRRWPRANACTSVSAPVRRPNGRAAITSCRRMRTCKARCLRISPIASTEPTTARPRNPAVGQEANPGPVAENRRRRTAQNKPHGTTKRPANRSSPYQTAARSGGGPLFVARVPPGCRAGAGNDCEERRGALEPVESRNGAGRSTTSSVGRRAVP